MGGSISGQELEIDLSGVDLSRVGVGVFNRVWNGGLHGGEDGEVCGAREA